jgi:hypothetical protein
VRRAFSSGAACELAAASGLAKVEEVFASDWEGTVSAKVNRWLATEHGCGESAEVDDPAQVTGVLSHARA